MSQTDCERFKAAFNVAKSLQLIKNYVSPKNAKWGTPNDLHPLLITMHCIIFSLYASRDEFLKRFLYEDILWENHQEAPL